MAQYSQLTFEVGSETLAYSAESAESKELKVRLDKWLWAARFFKTRALARSAIESGEVEYNGQKTIPSKEIELDATVLIKKHDHNRGKAVVIKGLSTRRKSTEESLALFVETGLDQSNVEYTPFSPSAKPRKTVRFLRRGMNMTEKSNNH